jgi:hypothetical protein
VTKFHTRPIFGSSDHPIGQKCLSAQKSVFSPTWIFFDNGLQKKIFFCLRYEHMYLKSIPLKWCYFVIWLKMEKNPQLRFPQNGIFMKKILVTFYCCFFRFFSINCQKVKVTNLTTNGQNYQILLETCFLSSLDTIW